MNVTQQMSLSLVFTGDSSISISNIRKHLLLGPQTPIKRQRMLPTLSLASQLKTWLSQNTKQTIKKLQGLNNTERNVRAKIKTT